MKSLIIYIAVFLFLFIVFFTEKKKTTFTSLEGNSYNIYADTNAVVSDQPTETILFKTTSPLIDLPSLNIFAELPVPDKFIARVVSKKTDANYVLISTQTQVQVAVLPKTVQNSQKTVVKKPEAKPKPDVPAQSSRPESKEITYNFFVLNNIIKDSDKTYFFTQKEKKIGDVTVRLYLTTPWKDKDILKFQVINNQQQYFFISNISLYEQKQLILADYYNEPLVGPEKTLECIVLMPRQKQKYLTLKLVESGGKNRNFSVDFNTP
jgi:ribosomal protein S17